MAGTAGSVAATCAEAGSEDLTLLGYCFGGTLAMLYLAGHSDAPVRNLAMVATPIDFTGDIKEIDGQPIAKRGRIPGLTASPRLRPVDLAAWRDGSSG